MALPRANGSSYDVFLSFRGEDTRHSFTDHLYAVLKQAGIKTFRDSDDAERGEELKKEICGAIKGSDASIIVLSENYATSTWCLDELSLILDRRRDYQCHHFVLPVFYKVDPSDVGQQKGTFSIAPNLNSSSRRWTDVNVNRWKAALTEVVGITGMCLVGSEADFLKEVVGTIYNRLDRKQIYIPPNLTGMDAREKEIKSWINQSECKFLVIYGMAGSGKSTLAQYIVYSNFQSFESVSIVEHIGRKCKEPHDMVKLQQQLYKDISRGKDRRIPSVCQGTPTIEVLLEQRKTLIILDDIVKESQLEDLLGSGNINKESKIIVTTDNDISNWFELKSRRCEEYKMKLLNDEESSELLSLHAFRSKTPMDGFKELTKRVVEYCEGSPLALKVLGSSLSKDNSIRSWESALNLFGKDFHSDIYGVLKRSYDSLPYDSDKELFLHIACFFVGKDMDYIVKILEPEYSAESKIKTLIKRCFLYVTPNKQLMMHRLLQDMGRSLVDRESRKLTERSRLWRNKDSYDMLRRGKSSDLLKGLTLDMQMLMEEDEFNYKQLKESPLTTESLQRMDQLKLLQLNYVKLTGSYKDSPHHLLWLCWFGYNESIIDSDIFMGNMVALDLSHSCLIEFEPPTVLQSLKILNFKDSRSLLEIRNIHLTPNLETLILWNCHRLLHVCKTIENLEKLALLNMTGCENLYDKKQLNSLVELKASTSGGESTQELSFPFPHSLQRLFLNNCKLECTGYFPLSFSDQSFLQYLNLGNSLFEELPCYIHLKNLRVLDLSLCSRLKSLLCLPSTLAELYVYYCKSMEKITFESGRFTLQEFGYEGCINLSEIEGLLKLVLIAKLDEIDLGHMMWLKEYENHDVCLVGDDSLTKDRSCRLQMLYEFDIMSTSLPDIKHPNLTPEYASQYTCLSFDVPLCPRSRSLKGLDVTFRYRISGEDWAWFCKISMTGAGDLMYNPKVFGKPASGKVGIWLSYWPIGNLLDVGDEVKVSIIVIRGLEVLECGARLVYTDDDVTGEILEKKMGWVETLGGDLSGFQLITGAYYLCRRDFFEQMEVGRLTPCWFNILVGDYIDSTEVRGWKMTGRPRQLYQSFTELKTVSCIMYEPETEKIYKISEMSESKTPLRQTGKEVVKPKEEKQMPSDDELKVGKNEIEIFKEVDTELLNKRFNQELPPRKGTLKNMSQEELTKLSAPFSISELSFSEIKDATRNFDPLFKIGEGGYGSVYRCFLQHTAVAVKMLHSHSIQGPSEFQQKVNVLSTLRHPNLVTLIGACPDAWIIVSEYLSGGSLEDRLNCKDHTPPLSWQNRIRIAVELCSVLIYLHSRGIVHGDLKPANLLLDKNLVSKLSDLGVCRVLSQNEFSSNNTSLSYRTDPKGTFVYMDPEFLSTGELTSKSDTYAFGIILLRLLTGRPALGITKEVQYALNKETLKSILDPTAGDWPFVQAHQLALLAMNCCDVARENRPDLETEAWRVLEPMRVSCGLSSLRIGSKGQRQIPPYFVCVISQEIMQDPVVAADGFTYEAEAFKGWLDSGHKTSPMTNLELSNSNVVPNHALRSAIQEWLQQP